MTEKANPSVTRPAEAFKTAGAIAYGGHGGSGFVVDGANPTENSVQDSSIAEANLNAFAETSSASSLDVTIDPGEAFVYGSWLAIDTSTTVTLAGSTAGQTVYVGWNKDGTDDVIVGLASAFASASGDADQKIPLWTFDTDGTGVTSVTDDRRIGYHQDDTTITGTLDVTGDISTDSGLTVTSTATVNGGIDLNVASGPGVLDFQSDNSVRSIAQVTESGTNKWTIRYQNEDLTFDDGSSQTKLRLGQNGPTEVDNATFNVRGGGDVVDSGGFLQFDASYTSPLAGRIVFGDETGWNMRFSTYNGTSYFDYLQINGNGGGVEVPTGDFNISSGQFFGLPQRTTDTGASVGQMWYRSDLD